MTNYDPLAALLELSDTFIITYLQSRQFFKGNFARRLCVYVSWLLVLSLCWTETLNLLTNIEGTFDKTDSRTLNHK